MSSPDKLTAKDIMLPADSYPVIYEDETVKRAFSKFQLSLLSRQNKRRNLLVLDRHDKPIGWVTLQDIFKIMYSGNLSLKNVRGWNLARLSGPSAYFAKELLNWSPNNIWESLDKNCQKVAGLKISEILRPLESGAVHASASLNAVAAVMSENNLSTLPVVENGKLVGFVRAEDIILEMAKLVMSPDEDKEKPTIPVTENP